MQAFTTIDYANDYFLTKPNTEAWDNLNKIDKEKQLCEATRRIYAIQGFKYTPELINILSDVPDDLQQACCEVVLNLIQNESSNNIHFENQKLGIKSVSFGKDSVSYDDKSNISSLGFDNKLFSDYAQSLLDKYIIRSYRYV